MFNTDLSHVATRLGGEVSSYNWGMSFYQVSLKAPIDVIFLFGLLFAWSAFLALGQFPFTRS